MASADPWPASSEGQAAASPTRATRPFVHDGIWIWLTRVEVEGRGPGHCLDECRDLPARAPQPLAQQRLLVGDALEGHRAVVSDREDHHGDVVAQRDPHRLEADLGVHHGDEFVARAVAGDVEHRDDDVLVALELLVRAEHQPADPGVQSVRSHDEIEVAGLPVLEGDPDSIPVVVESLHSVAQNQLGAALQCTVDGRGQIGPGDADVPLGRPHDRGRLHRGDPATAAVDGPCLTHDVPAPTQLGDDPHPMGHVEPGSPEVDQVATAAQLRRVLDQGGPVPCLE